ncbi:hypothetical protein IV77_GL001361 [Olsenella uli DSM 7084]|uniref:hypothetical protein n=1 Tax=Olsenella uli TaxID=133926 RepID=UPI000301C875|nr:hypothetical protein [Olsenella uli]KRO12236.1 hypothetical protein IV77_GL001361 [Olsenella uli DSM 7084]
MVAAFAVALERRMGAREALSYAVAVGSAAAMSPNTGDYDPSDRDDILPKVEVRTIGEGGHERALRDLRGAPPHLRGTVCESEIEGASVISVGLSLLEFEQLLEYHAFRYTRLGTRNMDFERMLESVVAIELPRRGYEAYADMP